MALFTVNRFLGDLSGSDSEADKPANAEDRLAQLHAQAERRKREQEEKDGQKESYEDHEHTETSSPKKKKEKPSPGIEEKVKKKKRKKKESDNELNEEIHEEESVSRKRKKKTKHSKNFELSENIDLIGDKDGMDKLRRDKDGMDKLKRDKDGMDKLKRGVDESSIDQKGLKKKRHNERKESVTSIVEDEDEEKPLKDDEELEEEEKTSDLVAVQEGGQEIGGFTVLGDFKKKNKEQVWRVLPEWLASPSVISADLRDKRLAVGDMPGLDAELVDTLVENNITHFFPVQMQVIPELLSVTKYGIASGPGGFRTQDVCVSAPTGSGKTLAFVLPIVQALKSRVVCHVRAVVVLPVKDLATQVYRVFQTYTQGTQLRVGLAVGQTSLSTEKHNLVAKRLRGSMSLVDVLVATPGRLVDHITQTDGLDLSHLRFLVIDEADRMMDDIKQDWLTTLESAVYHRRRHEGGETHREVPGPLTVANCSRIQMPLQKLLFSATLSQNPEKLQHLHLFQPRLFTSVVKVTQEAEKLIGQALTGSRAHDTDTTEKKTVTKGDFIGKYTTPLGLSEYMVRVTASEKPLVVLHLLHQLHLRHILCFTNSKEAAHRLHLLVKLVGDIEVEEFSSNLSAQRRNKIIKRFSAGKVDLLICSDAMARGMDVESIKYVISYDATHQIKTYIHRIGRTARAGKVGTAITLLENKEIQHFKAMLAEAGKSGLQDMEVDKAALSPLVPRFQAALKQLPQMLMEEKRKKKQKG